MALKDTGYLVKHGDCVETMRKMPANCVDAIVTDPPSGTGFMGATWDSDKGGRVPWVTWMAEVMTECLRVLKPGGHALVWALPRTSHWTATALELAGFEIRDVVTHHFGTGFPKSLDVSKAIDKAAGAEREVVGTWNMPGRGKRSPEQKYGLTADTGSITAPATDEAKQWDGWGTALKPASEHWILVRKPLAEGTVAANVLAYGTGALNIDACRVPHGAEADLTAQQRQTADSAGFGSSGFKADHTQPLYSSEGRWPTDLLLSHAPDCGIECVEACPVAEMDAQSGVTHSKASANRNGRDLGDVFSFKRKTDEVRGHTDSGGASRFFPIFRYQAKPSGTEKHAGVEKNTHPTVKAVELMRWLCRLVTPPQGIVLDPFCGSGSTGVACIAEGFRFIGLEQDAHNCEIANGRLEHARKQQGA